MANELTAEIFATGKWNGMDFRKEDLNLIANAFSTLGGNHQVPLKMGHNDDQPMTDGNPALGWVKDVWVEGEKLMARFIDMPDIVFEAIKKKMYKNVSIELDVGVEWKEDFFAYVLSGVALLGADIPAVNTLADLTTYMSRDRFAFSSKESLKFTYEKSEESNMTEAEIKELQAKLAEAEAKTLEFERKAKETEETARKAKFQAARKDLEGVLDKAVKADQLTPAQRTDFMAKFSDDNESVNEAIKFSVESLLANVKPKGDDMEKDTAKEFEAKDDEEGMIPSKIIYKRANELMGKEGGLTFSAARDRVVRSDRQLGEAWKFENDKNVA